VGDRILPAPFVTGTAVARTHKGTPNWSRPYLDLRALSHGKASTSPVPRNDAVTAIDRLFGDVEGWREASTNPRTQMR
jgi:hypothetical protein